MAAPFIVTVGRQFGSGGRILGQLLAQELSIEFYDKKLLLEAARHSGVLPEIYEHKDERMPSILSGAFPFTTGVLGTSTWVGTTVLSDERMQQAIADVIRDLAQTTSCVIVGRTADYVLRHNPRVTNIFVHAPEAVCVQRVLERGDCHSEADARAMCRKINKLRSSYYNFYTDRKWGHSTTYHLTVDSTSLPMEQLARLVAQYVSLRMQL